MKFIAPIALATAIFAILPFDSPAQTRTDIVNVDRVKQSLVQLVMGKPDGTQGSCTGFVIDPAGRIATAAHCTDDVEWIKADGIDTYVIVKRGWISILNGIPGSKPPLQFAKKKPQILEKVWAFGSPGGWGMFVFERQITAILAPEDADPKHDDIFIDGGLAPGMSGGPIVNQKGEVIAVNQMTFESFGMGCEIKLVKDALK